MKLPENKDKLINDQQNKSFYNEPDFLLRKKVFIFSKIRNLKEFMALKVFL